MSFLSHAPPLGGLSPPHGAFQEYAAHTLEWSKVLSSKGSMGTYIPKGVTTFVHTASRRTERRLLAVACRVEPVVTHPAPPQTRTCAINAYGSSSRAAAARARIPLLHRPLACCGQGS